MREKLKRFSVFKTVMKNEHYIGELEKYLIPTSISKGATIIKEGEAGETMYILLKGRIEIQKRTLGKQPYTVTILDESQNIFFGELALVDTELRSATVIALTDCELLTLSRKDFLELGNKTPEMGWIMLTEISHILSQRLRKANDEAIILFEALVNEISCG